MSTANDLPLLQPAQGCKWYVRIDKPECGLPAVATVKVKTRVTQATVALCAHHKGAHDKAFTQMREESRQRVTPKS